MNFESVRSGEFLLAFSALETLVDGIDDDLIALIIVVAVFFFHRFGVRGRR
jgi:hypothetical protein